MSCSPPGSTAHGIFQARMLKWVAISFSRGSSQPRDWTSISCVSCISRQILYPCTIHRPQEKHNIICHQAQHICEKWGPRTITRTSFKSREDLSSGIAAFVLRPLSRWTWALVFVPRKQKKCLPVLYEYVGNINDHLVFTVS